MRTSTERGGWLIVEDESLVAMLIEDVLAEMGLTTIGPATAIVQAFELIEQANPQGAVLDVNLAGERVLPVAERLAARGIPFVFVTGYGESGVPESFRTRPILQKPFQPADLQAAIGGLLGAQARLSDPATR